MHSETVKDCKETHSTSKEDFNVSCAFLCSIIQAQFDLLLVDWQSQFNENRYVPLIIRDHHVKRITKKCRQINIAREFSPKKTFAEIYDAKLFMNLKNYPLR